MLEMETENISALINHYYWRILNTGITLRTAEVHQPVFVTQQGSWLVLQIKSNILHETSVPSYTGG
jgi:hypothetical protein